MTTGWQCPKCGKIWAPTKIGCDACNAKTNELDRMAFELGVESGTIRPAPDS